MSCQAQVPMKDSPVFLGNHQRRMTNSCLEERRAINNKAAAQSSGSSRARSLEGTFKSTSDQKHENKAAQLSKGTTKMLEKTAFDKRQARRQAPGDGWGRVRPPTQLHIYKVLGVILSSSPAITPQGIRKFLSSIQ